MISLRLARRLLLLASMGAVMVATFIPFTTVQAQAPKPATGFGNFEVLDQLPIGNIDKDINKFTLKGNPLITTANILFQIGLVVLIMLSLIFVVIGGYIYMTAGGDSTQITTAKTYIKSALLGVILGLTGYLIFNTINPQITQPGKDPTIMPTR